MYPWNGFTRFLLDMVSVVCEWVSVSLELSHLMFIRSVTVGVGWCL